MTNNLIDNRQIRVFISSTFRDMQDERDYLMKRTFPKLRTLAAERDVTLTELDLRWGITEEESKSGKVVEICLREIENSIPFFIGIIGNRYGWVPAKEDLGGNVTERFTDVSKYIDQHLSVTEMEMQFGVLSREEDMHAYFYIKEQEESAENIDYPEMLSRLKEEVRRSKYPSTTYSSPENLAMQVEEAFIALLDQLFPQTNLSELEKERVGQRSFMNQLCQNYIKDDKNFAALDAWLANEDSRQYVITGASGLGKSAIIANWVKDKLNDSERKYNIIYHFTGNGGSESNSEHITKSLIDEINNLYGWEGSDADTKLSDLFVRVSAEDKPLLIVIDAINQIVDTDNAKLLNWLPAPTKNIKILFSTLEDDRTMEVFKNRDYPIFTLQPLDVDRRSMLVKNYLKLYAKTLTNKQVERIVTDSQCENTLVLKTLLDELINFGIYGKLDDRIEYYLKDDTIDDFFQALLSSYEEDYGKDFVTELLSTIELSRNGLTETEILDILNYGCADGSLKVKPLQWSQFFCSFIRNFISRNGIISFSHRYISDSVSARYLTSKNIRLTRRKIIDYCYATKSNRVFSEAAHQLYKLEEWQELYNAIRYLNVFYELYNSDKIALIHYWVGLLIADKEKYSPIIYINESTKVVPKRFLSTLLNELLIFISKDLHSPLIALECSTTVLETISSIYGSHTKETADVYNSLGGILYNLKRYKESLKYLENSLNIKKELGLECNKSVALTLNNMGYAYKEVGNINKSLELYQRAAELRKSLFGEDSLPFADSCFAIGTLYMDSRRNDTALKLFNKALNLYIRHCGEVSERVADCYGNMGLVYRSLQDYEQAILFHYQALHVRKEIFGTKHLYVAGSYRNIGNTFSCQGYYSKAIEMLHTAEDIQILIQGDNSTGLIDTYNDLGATYDSMQEYSNAINYYKKSLCISENNFGKNSYISTKCLNNLAVSYLSMNDNQKALDCLERVLKNWKKQYSPNHKRIGLCNINTGCALYKLGRKEEAHNAFLNAYDILKIFGEEDEHVMLCKKYLSYNF